MHADFLSVYGPLLPPSTYDSTIASDIKSYTSHGKMAATPQVLFADMQDASEIQMTFQDSIWSRTHRLARALSYPREVRARCSVPNQNQLPPVSTYGKLDLIVKFGNRVIVLEAACPSDQATV